MPQMGVSVSEGTITRWAKQVGDHVTADETIVEISTDKVDTEVPSPGTGIVTEILAAGGGAGDGGGGRRGPARRGLPARRRRPRRPRPGPRRRGPRQRAAGRGAGGGRA